MTQNDSPKRRKGDAVLISALASGNTVKDAARAAGIGEATAHRRLADPAFRSEVTQARSQLIEAATGQLADATGLAVSELRRLIERGDSDTVRHAASRTVLAQAVRYFELADIVARIEELERLLAAEATRAVR